MPCVSALANTTLQGGGGGSSGSGSGSGGESGGHKASSICRADWEPAAASGRRVLGMSWGCPAVLWGTIYTESNPGFMENPDFEKLAYFSCVHVDMWWIGPCGPSALLERSHVVWQSPSSWDKNCRLFKNVNFDLILLFMGQKGVLWVKKRCFGVFWAECEAADLKQRKVITTIDHRNKIQSLVLPTDDPGDAPDCITEYGPLPVNTAIYAIQHRPLRSMGFHRHPSCISPMAGMPLHASHEI